MEKFKVIIFPAAKQDLMEMIEYLNTLSSEVAIKQYDEIIEKINSLSEMPARCPLLKSNELRYKGYRVLVVNNYLVFFIISNGNTVEIRRILYGRRQYEFLL
ncbi:MAG TPA: type II toxin-antitoxin system RelE/ParE family toxin [Bacillota bacterium]|nr:type II toxin-antitoxin system RelE/ParE family toxin [Bacillota bacterium]